MDTRNVRLKRKTTHEEPLTLWQQGSRLALAVFILLLLFVAGLKWFAEHRHLQLNASSDLESQGLYLRLSMKKSSYSAGEPIDVQLLVKNISDQPVTLNFETDMEFDFMVQSELDLLFTQIPRCIWQYSSQAGHVPQPEHHSIQISPGKEQIFRGVWNQTNFSGSRVGSGRYIITGYLKSSNHAEKLQLSGQTQR